MNTPQIVLKNITRIYRVGEQDVYALNDVNITIEKGEYISIMGPSGSGKSTLLNMLGLLDRPNRGEYYLNQQNVSHLSDDAQASVRQKTIGFVFQAFHLVPRLTAAENVELPMLLAGIEPDERSSRVQQVMKDIGLQDRLHHRPEQLSGGQRQRVAIARATIMQPHILLADEPTGNLDRKAGNEVFTVLEQLNLSGITLVVVTHDLELGTRAKRQIKMVDGKISADSIVSPES